MGRRGRGGTWRRGGGRRGQRGNGSGKKSYVPNGVIGRVSVEPSKYAIEYHEGKAQATSTGVVPTTSAVDKAAVPEVALDPEEAAMMQMMGFQGFGSSKGKAVKTNQHGPAKGAARIEKKAKRQYRQYMNRKGGAQLLSGEASVKNKIQQ